MRGGCLSICKSYKASHIVDRIVHWEKEQELTCNLPLHQLPIFTDGHVRHRLQRHRQGVTRMSELARPHECTLVRQIRQVTGRRCRRRPGDGAVLACAKAALETLRAFLEHAQQRFLLPFVELPFQSVKQLCLLDQKFYGASVRRCASIVTPPNHASQFVISFCRLAASSN